MIASPSMYDPVQNPRQAKQRRDLVLERMREQRLITEPEYRDARAEALPTEGGGRPARSPTRASPTSRAG